MDSTISKYKNLSIQELEVIRLARKEMHEKFKATPLEGATVHYLDKEFIVFPNVFYPFEDSKPLIENFTIIKGESVLDIGTGSGVIGIFAAYKGAGRVLGIDINPAAVKTAKENVRRHNLESIIDIRLSDGFANIAEDEIFDVITMNPPFTNDDSFDKDEQSMNDKDLKFHKHVFSNIAKHLNSSGRVYVSQANFGAIEDLLTLAQEFGFKSKLIGERKMKTDPRIFYAFELTR